MTGGRYGAAIFPQHARLLEESAISPEVAAARGYVSVDTKGRLEAAGFGSYQRRVPGLLIPVHDVTGAVVLCQYRPDHPRVTKKGTTVKYETPGGARMVLDVPPAERSRAGDPKVPLWITEGIRKADSAVSAGLCCVALLGVTAFRGTNKDGGKVALADWESVALNGRQVFIAFDSDVMLKRSVHQALVRLGAFLARRGASVAYVYLPAGESGAKTGLDDYFAAGGNAGDLVLRARDEPVEPELPGTDDDTVSTSLPSAEPAHLHTPPSWASDQDILARMVCDLRVCSGLVGEDRNAQLIYLALTSRLLDDPVSLAIKGLSSSGKSFTVETVMQLFPEEAVYTMTAMSEKALIYLDESLEHRTIVLYEAVALREGREKAEDNQTAYIVRSLLSEGHIRYPVATRGEDGKIRTEVIVKEGPTNFIVTTTSISLHPENETRMLSLPTNDTRDQTRAVLRAIAADSKRQEADWSEWHALQRWLAGASHRVVVPYMACLAEQVPVVAVRIRRDFTALKQLIKAHAILHQRSRETDEYGRIIATEADYQAVRRLVHDLMSDAVGATVPASVRETVQAVAKLDPGAGEGVTVRTIAEHLGLERSAASRRLQTAASRGYLVNLEDKRGKPARYAEGDPMPEELVMLPEHVCAGVQVCSHINGPAQVPAQDETAGQHCNCQGVCRCAASAGPIQACTMCGEPLAQALIDAGFTDHGELE